MTTRTAVPDAVPALTPRRRRAILAVVALSLMAVVSAVSGLNVALPSLARDTGASQTQLTWIVDAYTVVFAGLLLFAGALGDRYGRRRLLLVGLVVFGVAAAVGLVTTEPGQLIVVRVLMGIGAAAIMPTTLSVITTSFPEEERPRAIGVWVGIAGGGAILGLFVTGLLLQWFPWTSFFGLNVTLAVLAFIGCAGGRPELGRPAPAGSRLVGRRPLAGGRGDLRLRHHRGSRPRLDRPSDAGRAGHRHRRRRRLRALGAPLAAPDAGPEAVPPARVPVGQPDHQHPVPGRLRLLLRVHPVSPVRHRSHRAGGGHRPAADAAGAAAGGPPRPAGGATRRLSTPWAAGPACSWRWGS